MCDLSNKPHCNAPDNVQTLDIIWLNLRRQEKYVSDQKKMFALKKGVLVKVIRQ